MRRQALLVLLLLFHVGCVGVSSRPADEPGGQCGAGADFDSNVGRLSFERSSLLQGLNCTKGLRVEYFASADMLSLGANSEFRNENKVLNTASISFVVDGRLDGGQLGERLSPEEFEVFYRESQEYPRLRNVVYSRQLKRAGMPCVQFVYTIFNPMRKVQEVEYWCWESISGVLGPFRVSAFEAVSPGEEWRIDFEKEFFEPFFSTVRVNKVSPDVLARVDKYHQDDCRRNKEFFEQKGVGWLAADYQNNRRALLLMKRCGNSVVVPAYDGRPLIPTAKRLWDHASERKVKLPKVRR